RPPVRTSPALAGPGRRPDGTRPLPGQRLGLRLVADVGPNQPVVAGALPLHRVPLALLADCVDFARLVVNGYLVDHPRHRPHRCAHSKPPASGTLVDSLPRRWTITRKGAYLGEGASQQGTPCEAPFPSEGGRHSASPSGRRRGD